MFIPLNYYHNFEESTLLLHVIDSEAEAQREEFFVSGFSHKLLSFTLHHAVPLCMKETSITRKISKGLR